METECKTHGTDYDGTYNGCQLAYDTDHSSCCDANLTDFGQCTACGEGLN